MAKKNFFAEVEAYEDLSEKTLININLFFKFFIIKITRHQGYLKVILFIYHGFKPKKNQYKRRISY